MNQNICRLCLSYNTSVNIFQKDENSLLDMIKACCPVDILEGDGLPEKVCKECVESLSYCNKFRDRCIASDKILRQQNGAILSGVVKLEQVDLKYEFDDENILDNQRDDVDFNYDDLYDDNKDTKHEDDSKPVIFDSSLLLDPDIALKHVKKRNSSRGKVKKKQKSSHKIKKKHLKVFVSKEESQTDDCLSFRKRIKQRRLQVCEFIPCDLCGKSIKKTNMKVHQLTHSSEKNYSCEYCSKRFKVKGNMLKHIKAMHSGDTTVTCDICKNVYSNRGSLKVHITMVHMPQVKASCDICCRQFKNISLLRSHMRTHTLERPYKCKYCDKSFSIISTRLDHERLHTGFKPYKCPCCSKAFVQLSNMKSHFKYNHKDKVFKDLYKPLPRSRTKRAEILNLITSKGNEDVTFNNVSDDILEVSNADIDRSLIPRLSLIS